VKAASKDKGVHVIVLTGAGEKAFSAGNDLASMAPNGVALAAIEAIEAAPQPVIAAVNGLAYTGALELLLACDILLSAESAVFQDTHGKLGLVPTWGGSMRWPRKVGLSAAKEFLFTGASRSAAEMKELGFLDRVCPGPGSSAVREAAAEMARGMAENMSRSSLAKQKKMMNLGFQMNMRDALLVNNSFHPGHADDMMERMAKKPAGNKPAAKL
jgi:enoyl-CoA hydratase